MKIQLKHISSGLMKEAKIGFSWTTLFFGFLVPLLRGDFIWAILMFLLTGVSFGFLWIIFPFIYNGIYIKNLLTKGFQASNDVSTQALVQKGWLAPNHAQAPVYAQTPVQQQAPVYAQTPVQQQAPVYAQTPAQQQAPTQVMEKVDLKDLISQVMARHPQAKKAWSGDNLPEDKKKKLLKKSNTINPTNEVILFAGLYGMRSMVSYGVIITDRNIHCMLASGMMATTKQSAFPHSSINSITAEHVNVHGSYGGGNPGPEITINGKMIGYIQLMMVMSDEDEALLIELINEINRTGALFQSRDNAINV